MKNFNFPFILTAIFVFSTAVICAADHKSKTIIPNVPIGVEPQHSWFGIQDGIYFYNKDEPYYEFTNFYPALIRLDEKEWPRTEHYFQAQKFPDNPSLQDQIRQQKSAREVFSLARKYKPTRRKDWNKIKVQVIIKIKKAKMVQHPEIKKMLLQTAQRTIVENAGKNDAWWGAGADGTGKNMLGRVLMYVRSALQDKEEKCILDQPIESFKN